MSCTASCSLMTTRTIFLGHVSNKSIGSAESDAYENLDRGTDAPFDRQLKQLLLKEIKTIIEQHYGPIDAEIRMKIDGIPARAVAEARRLYHTPPPDTETSGDPSEDGTTTNVSLPPAEERTFNGDSSMPIIATRRSSTTPYWPPSAIHGEPSTVRQYRPTATDTIQDVFVNRQGRVGSQQTVHPHHTSTTTNTSHAQLQQAQPILGQSQEEYNLHPAQALSPEAQLPQNYFMQPPFTSGHSHRSAAAMMNSMQPGSWDNISAQQAESAFPSWPSGSTPFPRPETTPPIASMSHHPALPSMNAQYWTSPPSPMPLGDWSGNLGFPVAPNMRRNSYANPPPTQRYFASPQTTPNFSQPMIPDQNLFSVREQNQDFFTDQHQFNTVQARPYLSARGRNPFGPFPSIHEEIVEQTDEPDYEGVGQNMDRSP
jgi:hypothetical protein